MAEQQARGEQFFPGGLTMPAGDPIYPPAGSSTDPTQRDILNLDILRTAQTGGGSPEEIVARATAYQKWIKDNA